MVQSKTKKYNMLDQAKYIPLRLSHDERKQLNILIAALHVSEYVDKVDLPRYQRQDLIISELKDLLHIIWGLHIACGSKEIKVNTKDISETKDDEESGDTEMKSDEVVDRVDKVYLKENGDYFASLFEIGRRYKIMNPDKMRSDYGKLLYMMQDACSPESIRGLGFNPYKPIVTVEQILRQLNLIELLNDPRLEKATASISTEDPVELEQHKRIKEALIFDLCNEFAGSDPKDPKYDALERCIRSIDDANCYVRDNVCTLDQMIQYLHHYFGKSDIDKTKSLEIWRGKGGSCLSHDHSTQFVFVLQSLTLWKVVQLHMFRLWHVVEEDMLDAKQPYRYRYTGQGYNRVQPAYRISSEMRSVLHEAMQEVGKSWVGLSVVHLGDNDVPNALNFIDKYTQVPRIINPIVKCIQGTEDILKWPGIKEWMDRQFSNTENLKCVILRDFFRHGFDGSGDDGGSCIDGRLTSAWNWCQQLSNKKYLPVFQLTGFSSFDGQF